MPRHRERFDDVAKLVRDAGADVLRRSSCETSNRLTADAVILLDTIGELSACWGLADIAFVGGSFGNRGGQNMIEPAAFGATVLFGPNTWNFRDVVQTFKEANACVQLDSPAELTATVARLLANPAERQSLGDAARRAVKSQSGATANTATLLTAILESQQANHAICQRAA